MKGISVVCLVAEQGPWIGAIEHGSAQVRSWACPGVSITSTGLPSASTRTWILVVSPPRERPIACAPFFFVRRPMLVSAHDGGVDHHVLVVVVARQQLENALEKLMSLQKK